jgi:hypothetical protein
MDVIAFLAEGRIKAAMERGEFDNLRGKGRPLILEDDSRIPPELRMAYKILKNSGHAPPEIEEHKEILSLRRLLAQCPDEKQRLAEAQRLNYLITKANQRRRCPVYMEMEQVYEHKAMHRLQRR